MAVWSSIHPRELGKIGLRYSFSQPILYTSHHLASYFVTNPNSSSLFLLLLESLFKYLETFTLSYFYIITGEPKTRVLLSYG